MQVPPCIKDTGTGRVFVYPAAELTSYKPSCWVNRKTVARVNVSVNIFLQNLASLDIIFGLLIGILPN